METPDRTELLCRTRCLARELEENFVADDPTPRDIAPFRLAFPPCGQLPQYRGRAWLKRVPPSNPLITILRLPRSFPCEVCSRRNSSYSHSSRPKDRNRARSLSWIGSRNCTSSRAYVIWSFVSGRWLQLVKVCDLASRLPVRR